MTGNDNQWDRDAVYYHYYEYPAEHMVNRHYAIVTKDYKLIHYYFIEDQWELIDRKNDPLELRNEYNNPNYTAIKNDLHKKLEELRNQYKDNDNLNQYYIDRLMDDVSEGKIRGLSKEKVQEIKDRRKSIKTN